MRKFFTFVSGSLSKIFINLLFLKLIFNTNLSALLIDVGAYTVYNLLLPTLFTI